jgi:hypothetical protein
MEVSKAKTVRNPSYYRELEEQESTVKKQQRCLCCRMIADARFACDDAHALCSLLEKCE